MIEARTVCAKCGGKVRISSHKTSQMEGNLYIEMHVEPCLKCVGGVIRNALTTAEKDVEKLTDETSPGEVPKPSERPSEKPAAS